MTEETAKELLKEIELRQRLFLDAPLPEPPDFSYKTDQDFKIRVDAGYCMGPERRAR